VQNLSSPATATADAITTTAEITPVVASAADSEGVQPLRRLFCIANIRGGGVMEWRYQTEVPQSVYPDSHVLELPFIVRQ
jgi:hypothetical protein